MTLDEIREACGDVAKQLRELDQQYVHDRDNVFAKMADTVEATVKWMDEDDRDIVIDDLIAKLDRVCSAMRDIKRECGHREINNGTSTLGLFIDQILCVPPRVKSGA